MDLKWHASKYNLEQICKHIFSGLVNKDGCHIAYKDLRQTNLFGTNRRNS